MDKKPFNLGLHSGPPPYASKEAVREQLRQMPKASAPCLATRAARPSKTTPAAPTSASSPRLIKRAKPETSC